MQAQIREWLTNPIVGFVLTVVGLALTAFGVYLTRRYKPRRRIEVARWSNVDFLTAVDIQGTGIAILHNGISVPGLSELSVTLRNKGTEVLRPQDFHLAPTLSFSGSPQILHVEATSSAGHVEPRALLGPNSTVYVDFKFLEPANSIRVRIVYGAKTSLGGLIQGKIIGGNELQSVFRTNRQFAAYREGKDVGKIVYMFLVAVLLTLGLTFEKWLRQHYDVSALPGWFTKGLVFVLAAAIGLKVGLTIQRRREAKLIKELVTSGRLEASAQDDLLSP
jgi:hypothetical protein